jgi:aminotransferase in exopolysaccharide biosynthesis
MSNSIEAWGQALIKEVRQLYAKPADELIPLHAPCFDQREKDLVADCINSTFVSSVGQYVSEFETQIAQTADSAYGVAVVNGTMGLYLALKVLGIQSNDLVITQSLTFVATANAISMHGAQPLFVDVSKETLGMNADALAVFMAEQTYQTENGCFYKKNHQRIAACMPMHTLGMPCEIEKIVEICHQHNIPVVEDAAESLGSRFQSQNDGQWRSTGSIGDIGVFSFNGNKILTTGGGGVLVTQDKSLAEHAKHLSTTAKKPHPWLFEHDEIGYNLRLPNLNAALGVAQMAKLDAFLTEKRQIHQQYRQILQEISQSLPESPVLPSLLRAPEQTEPNFWLNGILCADQNQRDALLKQLNQAQIQARPLWTPLHQQEIYQTAHRTPLPNTEWLAERVINIPSGVRCYNKISSSGGV